MLWECGNSFVFYFLMGYLPASETRGIALRGINSDEILCFLFSVHMSICLCTLAWH